MRIPSLIVACCALLSAWASAAQVEFDITPKVMRLGEVATCSFTITAAKNPQRPQFPPKEGWQIQYAGTQHSFASSPQGMISTVTYQYRLLPLKVGKDTFGPIAYQVDGQLKQTGKIDVEVLASKEAETETDVELTNFIMAKLDTEASNIYNHQVFDLTLSVYYRALRLSSDMRLVEIQDTGFKLTPFKAIPSGREVIDGELYTVQRFRASARAITTGTFTLAPIIRVNIFTERDERNRFNPFFERMTMRQTQPFDVTAEALELTVKALPEEGRPDDFSGAVGKFSFNAAVRPTKLNVGDPITVTMQLSGAGNMDSVLAPKLAVGDTFKIYDAKMQESALNESETAGKRVFEQVLIPVSDTITELPAMMFSYFDPQLEKYITLKRGPFPLRVTAVAGQAARVVSGSSDPGPSTRKKMLGQDIVYLKMLPDSWRRGGVAAWYNRPGFLGLQAIPPLILICCYLAGRRRKVLESDVAKARRHQAPKQARAAVRKAQEAIRADDASAFFAALWEGLSAYFSNRLNIGAGEVSTEIVRSAMAERGMSESKLDELTALFDTVDEQRYGVASQFDGAGKKALLDRMTALLKTCERLR